MTAAHRPPRHHPTHAQTAVIDCRGTRMSAHIDGRLTVLTIKGEVDAANIDTLTRHLRPLVPNGGALIVDLAGLEFLGGAGLRALIALNIECARTDTTWAVIAGHAVDRLLRVADRDGTLPAFGSATEALLHVRRTNPGRRSLQLAWST